MAFIMLSSNERSDCLRALGPRPRAARGSWRVRQGGWLPGRRFCVGLGAWLLLLLPPAMAANEIRHADHLWQGEDRLLVRVQMDLELPDVLRDALANGVGVDFVSEVRLEYRRGLLGERQVMAQARSVRLEYYALSRHYAVTDLQLQKIELAPTLGDALDILSRRLGRMVLDLDRASLRQGRDYTLATRILVDHAALPLPLQWDARLRGAYVTRLGWYRWPLD